MKVEVNLYANLACYMPYEKRGSMKISEGATIMTLLNQLNVPINDIKLIFLNGIRANVDEVLKDGDKIGIFPAIGGG